MKKRTNISTSNNTSKKDHSPVNNTTTIQNPSQFPIWEKIYLDTKELKKSDNFFSKCKSILIENEVYLFPSTKQNTQENIYAKINLENTQITFHNMIYDCFYPILNPNNKIIYLYTYDSSYNSDYRYSLIEFNIIDNSFNLIQQKGVPPKARNETFTSFLLGGKIFFFGGVQKFSGDISINHLFSFNLKELEWNIEEINQIYHNDNSSLNYLSNTYDVSCININENKVLLIGGKFFDDVFYSNTLINLHKNNIFESSEIVEFNIEPNISFNFSKIENDIKFGFFSCCLYKNLIYIHNNGKLYLYDYEKEEISMLKPRLFEPEAISNTNIFVYNGFLYLIGQFKCYEDCYAFKTSLEKINIKWNNENLISYENLLNYKDCSDMICSFNNEDKTKELYLNKKILFNFSLALKNLINCTQKSNVYIFNDINFVTMFNILKFIYSNFNEEISKIDIEILKEIFFVLFRYRAKSLLNIIVSHLKLSNDKVVQFYELAQKYNFQDLMQKCKKYISENLNNGIIMNEGIELKKNFYQNYFCQHKLYIQCNIAGIEIKNIGQVTLTNEKVNEIKELSQGGKLYYCLNCKKVFSKI